MLRSMTSVISGLNINQTALDIIGNNIANMSTVGFKAQRAVFADTLSQNYADAKAPSPNLGGSNPIQIGLGATIAGVDTLLGQGNFQPTSRNLDCAIDGNGYFAVAEGPTLFNTQGDEKTKESISIDIKTHNVTKGGNPRGANIMYTRDGSFTLDKDGNLITSGGLRVLGFPMVNTQTKVDGKDFDFSTIQSIDDKGSVNFVDSNAVDGQKFTAIRTYVKDGDTSFQLKTLKIPETVKCPVTDDTGAIKFNPNDTAVPPTEYKEVRVKTFNIEKTGIVKAVLDDGTTTVIGQIALVGFNNPAGLLKTGRNILTETSNSGEASFKSGYVGKYQKDAPVEADGTNVKDYSGIDKDNSLSDNSKAFGTVMNGVLEMSNVDIAEQFTKMIEATRAFQANGKMISTGDEILQDLVNLKR